MKCPVCTETDLLMSERQGAEIDYCPKCRGIWMDRGKLEKMIERAAGFGQAQIASAADPNGHRRDNDDEYQGQPYPKKKSWFQEIFD
jgi:Zn-finger nucleic acid-binding protein